MSMQTIRTLVVDDSVFMRSVLKNALSRADGIEVIGSAQNGTEGLDKIRKLKPDVVTLDIEMPGMTGLEVLEVVMKECPLPIVVVSTKTQEGAQMTFDALELGAFDYVAKPLSEKTTSLQSFQEKVINMVRAAYVSNRKRLGAQDKTRVLKPRKASIRTDDIVVAIGISAGGPATLHKLIPILPKVFPPIVLTQHMPADFTKAFAERMNASAQLEVVEAETGMELVPGRLLLAPGRCHLRIKRQGKSHLVKLDDGPKVSGFRPSVDVMFKSVAETFKSRCIGLVMTGMGFDGSEGTKALKEAGGQTLAQDQESSIVFGMPKAAFETGCVDRVISLAEIPDTLVRMLSAATANAPS